MGFAAKLLWKASKFGPDLRVSGDDRSRLAIALEPEIGVRQRRRIEIARGIGRGFDVGQSVPGFDDIARDRAVNRAGIQVRQAVMRRNPPRERAFSGRRRPVNRNNHQPFAPSSESRDARCVHH